MKFIRTLYLATALSVAPMWLSAQQTAGDNYFLHTIAKGQSIYSIAIMYDVSTDDIIQLNPHSRSKIKAGDTLKIPQKKSATGQVFHTIKAGETLYKLTKQYGVSANRILLANPGLTSKAFRIGQVILIPSKQVAAKGDTTQPVVQEENKTVPEPKKPKYRDMHKIQRRETVYSISRMYGLTEDELIAANPEIKNKKKLKRGKFLVIPFPKAKKEEAKKEEMKDTPKSNEELINENKVAVKDMKTIKAAVMLPFAEQPRMVEYYEGFLMAADSLKRRGVSLDLYTYDTGNKATSIQPLLNKPEMKEMNIIFGPVHPNHTQALSEFAKKHNIRLVIPFSSKDTKVFTNPAIYQINTPQSYLYSEVYEHFTRKFTKANVIFIDVADGNKEKVEFIRGLKEELNNKQIKHQTINQDQLIPEQLKARIDSTMENVFIPTTGTNIALIRILPQLIVTVRENPNTSIKLFGYPEWQVYTDDHLAKFYELDTYFYSSFYTNNLFPAAVNFSQKYRHWYSKEMSNTFPRFGMLGFDTGYYFLNALARYGNHMEESLEKISVTPIQTGFKFERVNNWGGFINKKVFFVNFSKNFELIKLDFE